ncbi:xanthine dehydrogenase family protein molybdopterin-binding subunit [Eoetvoesiella caeni]|nr:molybdopterin cofactor-binding domain-containing protein [Eoetvoesiella caeni]MCI2811275.1 molybdopterin-dependent oxidoreductase [Eoetvoesiella caeni]NYT57164.1 xanthine dehydrogenase family protein molybdopterin-binding subunit [Eoetvoesiella caeni]
MSKSLTISPSSRKLSRREFLVRSGAITCAVMFSSSDILSSARAAILASDSESEHSPHISPNIWVRFLSDGSVEIVCPALELGQGAHTSLPRFVAEELDIDWNDAKVVQAGVNDELYGNPLAWNTQITAASRTCVGYFDVLRVAGAQARYVLLDAASRLWAVETTTLSTEPGIVVHHESGRRIAYRDLLEHANVPDSFPRFFALDELPQPPDDYFGDPPPSIVAPRAETHDAVPLKHRDKYRLIGTDASRRDIEEKTRGTASYAMDIQLPGMLYAVVETGPTPSSTPTEVDDADALKVAGVEQILRLPYGIAVIGSRMSAINKGRRKLRIQWRSDTTAHPYDSKDVLDEFASMARNPAFPAVRAWHQGDRNELSRVLSYPDTGEHYTFEMTSELVYQAPLEPQNATIAVADDGQSALGWVGTQWPTVDLQTVASILEIPPEKLTLHVPYVGGGFGRRLEPGAIVDAAHIAKTIRRPIKVIWTREDDLKRNPFRQALACKIEATTTKDGSICAIRHRIVADSWLARLFPNYFELYQQTDPGNWVGARHAYDIPLQAIDVITPRRSIPICYMRGIGVAQIKFAQESLINQIAARLGVDAIQYRLKQLRAEPRAINVLQTVADMSDWGQRGPAPDRRGRALGVAYTPYSNAHVAMVADVSIDQSSGQIRVHQIWCAVDVGMAVQPDIVISQMEGGITQGLSVALLERVNVSAGAVQQTNFHDYPILRCTDAPPITIKLVDLGAPMAGVGELGMMQIAPAINNAVAQIIGTHLHALPMTPENVLEALRGKATDA